MKKYAFVVLQLFVLASCSRIRIDSDLKPTISETPDVCSFIDSDSTTIADKCLEEHPVFRRKITPTCLGSLYFLAKIPKNLHSVGGIEESCFEKLPKDTIFWKGNGYDISAEYLTKDQFFTVPLEFEKIDSLKYVFILFQSFDRTTSFPIDYGIAINLVTDKVSFFPPEHDLTLENIKINLTTVEFIIPNSTYTIKYDGNKFYK
jgi:hypothetical protein